MPPPIWTTAPLPLMTWDITKAVSPRSNTSMALSVIPPDPSVPALPPLPTWTVPLLITVRRCSCSRR